MFEAVIEGHTVTIELGPLAEFEAYGWLDGLTLGVVAVLVLAVWGEALARGSVPARVFVTLLTFSACAFGALMMAGTVPFAPTRGSGHVFSLFPELRARFAWCGTLPWVAMGLSAGALVAVALDVPAWAQRRFAAQGGRALVCGFCLSVSSGAYLLSGPVRAHAEELGAIESLPHVRFEEPVELHVSQSLVLTPRVTQIGLRTRPGWFIFRANYVEHEPGSPQDLANLSTNGAARVAMDADEQALWLPGSSFDAPPTPGPFTVPVRMRRGPIQVEVELSATAIDDAGDASFPLEVGTRRVYARSTLARGAIEDGGRVTLEVTEAFVEDGFRRLRVETTRSAEGEPVATRRVTVSPREGRYQRRDGTPWLGAGDPGATLPEGQFACVVPGLGACVCAEVPAAGPVRCTETEHHTPAGNATAVTLGVLTAGITFLAGVAPRPSWDAVTELRLVEADGVTVDVPTRLEVERRRRRRSR